jgi:hypothetical protein
MVHHDPATETRRARVVIRIAVHMTDHDVVERVRDNVGLGTVLRKPPGKPLSTGTDADARSAVMLSQWRTPDDTQSLRMWRNGNASPCHGEDPGPIPGIRSECRRHQAFPAHALVA